MKMTEAEKFYKEHKDYCNPNPMTGDYVIEPDDLFRIMEDYHQHKVNNGVLGDVSVLLPKLKECQDARKDFINKKAQSGYSTLLKGVGDHFQAGVNWALNYISNKR